MKKRFIAFVLTLVIVLSFAGVSAFADSDGVEMQKTTSTLTVVFSDGSFYVDKISQGNQLFASGIRSGNKTRTYYKSNGAAAWSITVYGSFSYTGSTANCTSASHSRTIYDSAWWCSSIGSYRSGASAIAYGTFNLIGKAEPTSITLSCTANGGLY